MYFVNYNPFVCLSSFCFCFFKGQNVHLWYTVYGLTLFPKKIKKVLLLTSFLPRVFTGDETYQDIFQDFTHMASNDPDKLNRY